MKNINENWKQDLDLDEAFGGGYKMAICGKGYNAIAEVFGETKEICEKRTKLMASSPKLVELLFKIKDTLSKEWPKEEWIEFDAEVGFTETLQNALSND